MSSPVKTAFFFAVCFLTAKVVFAQITVDLDVLTEDFVPKDAITSAPAEQKKNVSSPALKAPAAAKTKKQPAAKAKPAAKPVVKKTAPPKKPAKPSVKKKAAKPVEKYQIRETAKKDEHDRLKPRANPVPKVKILASDDSVKPAEETAFVTTEAIPEKPAEPKISKHFLEQERLKQQEAEQTRQTASVTETPAQPEKEPEPVKDSFLTLTPENRPTLLKPKTLLSAAERETPDKQTPAQPDPVKFSVFYVSGKLTPAERSAILAKEVPADSATKKALDQKKELLHIFVFESKSSALTDEMRAALDSTAEIMKKNRDKHLLLYSYSAADPAEPGKERQYALRRALMIRSYLTQKGIHSLRIEMRSFGQKGAGEKMPDRTDILIEDK